MGLWVVIVFFLKERLCWVFVFSSFWLLSNYLCRTVNFKKGDYLSTLLASTTGTECLIVCISWLVWALHAAKVSPGVWFLETRRDKREGTGTLVPFPS